MAISQTLTRAGDLINHAGAQANLAYTERFLAVDVPNPDPKLPDGKWKDGLDTGLGYVKGIGIVAAVASLVVLGILMSVGSRGRSDLAKNAITHFPYVFGGLLVISGAAQLVQLFI